MQDFSKRKSPQSFEDLTSEEQEWFRREHERTQLQIVEHTPDPKPPEPKITDKRFWDIQ